MIAADIKTTLASALPRLFHMEAPAGTARPYGVLYVDDSEPVTHLDGESTTTHYDIELEVFAASPALAATSAASVRAAMDTASLFRSVCTGFRDIFDFDTSTPGIRILFSIIQ